METRSWCNCCGCIFNSMEQKAFLCISILCSYSHMLTDDHSRRGRGSVNCTHVAHSDVLPEDNVHVDSTAEIVTEEGEPVEVPPFRHKPPPMAEDAADGMSRIRKRLETAGVPKETIGIMLRSWRKSTRGQYGVHFSKWTTFCCERKIVPHDISVNNVLKFLTFLFELGLGYSLINTARSAISSLGCGSTCPVGNHPFYMPLHERGLHFKANTVALQCCLGC